MASLDALVLRSKDLCTAASEDEVVQQLAPMAPALG